MIVSHQIYYLTNDLFWCFFDRYFRLWVYYYLLCQRGLLRHIGIRDIRALPKLICMIALYSKAWVTWPFSVNNLGSCLHQKLIMYYTILEFTKSNVQEIYKELETSIIYSFALKWKLHPTIYNAIEISWKLILSRVTLVLILHLIPCS